MMYDKELMTVYKADNGFVVKVRHPKKEEKKKKSDKDSGCYPCGPSYDETMHVCKNDKDVLATLQTALKANMSDDDKYAEAFEEEAKKQ